MKIRYGWVYEHIISVIIIPYFKILTEDGKIFCWGWNKYGQVNHMHQKTTLYFFCYWVLIQYLAFDFLVQSSLAWETQWTEISPRRWHSRKITPQRILHAAGGTRYFSVRRLRGTKLRMPRFFNCTDVIWFSLCFGSSFIFLCLRFPYCGFVREFDILVWFLVKVKLAKMVSSGFRISVVYIQETRLI